MGVEQKVVIKSQKPKKEQTEAQKEKAKALKSNRLKAMGGK